MLEEEQQVFKRADADTDNSEYSLDEYEWLGFRHPELSKTMLKGMAEEILNAFGKIVFKNI